MKLDVTGPTDTTPARIVIQGAFDFGLSSAFRDALETVRGARSCIVDLADTTYVDSSALGMLLILKEEVQEVSIANPSTYARKVLNLAGFDTIFDVR